MRALSKHLCVLEKAFVSSFICCIEKYPRHFQRKRFVIGCSGGADSLALTLLCTHHLEVYGMQFHVGIVDHGLRQTSKDEAQSTMRWLIAQGVSAEILHVESTCTGNLQHFARTQRLNLLAQCAQKQDCDAILLAHHRRDQAETVLERLHRGSHAVGLSAMQPIARYRTTMLMRPLLNATPEDLRLYTRHHHAPIIDDPSNNDRHFLRVRARQLLCARPKLEDRAIELAQAARRPAQTELSLSQAIWQQHVDEPYAGILRIPLSCWHDYPDWALIRTLGNMIRYVGARIYPPRYAKIRRLLTHFIQPNPSATTLGRVRLQQIEDTLWLMPETPANTNMIAAGETHFWPHHWQVSHSLSTPLKLSPISRAIWRKQFPSLAHHAFIAHCFPALHSPTHIHTPLDTQKDPKISFFFNCLRQI